MKTLVVDDNPSDRKILRYYLERHGCEIAEAPDGKEGLEAVKRELPDLIISDALMPKMDGFQFLRKVKSDPQLRAIPFIFYSAVYRGTRDEKLALALGADAYIVKPKEPEALWGAIKTVLEKRKPVREVIVPEQVRPGAERPGRRHQLPEDRRQRGGNSPGGERRQ